jgi:hypothetical protein
MATGRPSITTFPAANPAGFHDDQTTQQLYLRAAASPWSKLRRRLSQQSNFLEVLEEATCLAPGAGATAAVQSVAIAQIAGSVERARSQDFDPEFRPRNPQLKERWLSVAARRQAGGTLPPVDLVQVGERYFVVDGHHRISVDRALGHATIRARVTMLC